MRLLDLRDSPLLVTDVFLVLVIHSVHLSVNALIREQWLFEELTEDIESPWKAFILYVKIIVSVVLTCGSVLLACVRSNKLGVVVLNWVLLGS